MYKRVSMGGIVEGMDCGMIECMIMSTLKQFGHVMRMMAPGKNMLL